MHSVVLAANVEVVIEDQVPEYPVVAASSRVTTPADTPADHTTQNTRLLSASATTSVPLPVVAALWTAVIGVRTEPTVKRAVVDAPSPIGGAVPAQSIVRAPALSSTDRTPVESVAESSWRTGAGRRGLSSLLRPGDTVP